MGLDIVTIGMVTAVGLDAPSSCAAVRARLDGFQQTDFTAGGHRLTGAPVPMPRAWIGEKKIAHMAAAAICEVFANFGEARGQSSLILCMAEGDRPGRPAPDEGRLLRRIAEIVEVGPYSRSQVVAHGRPSGHIALYQAQEILTSGKSPFVLIVGVDSYLTGETISHYLHAKRLLAPDNPNGFIPGEAAAAILCRRSESGGFRLFGLGLTREPASIYNSADLPLRADGMTEAYRAALTQSGIELRHVGYRIADLIGEQYWFKQSALTKVRLLRGRHEFQDIWSPGESLGNIGAAVVPLMIGIAFTAAQKGYAAGNPVLIEASNDSGACGAAVLAAIAVR